MASSMDVRRLAVMAALVLGLAASFACDDTTPVVRTAVPQAGETSPPGGEAPAEAFTPTSVPPTTAPLGSSRSNPAPPGSAVEIAGMTIRILDVQRPADDVVAEANPFNDPPEGGNEYLIVTIEVACNKSADEQCVFEPGLELTLVGSKGIVYDREYVAGIDYLERTELFGGATKSGLLVFQCGAGETDLVMIYEEFIGFREAYLALP